MHSSTAQHSDAIQEAKLSKLAKQSNVIKHYIRSNIMAKQMVVRLAPVSNVPMFVDANSLNNGRLKAIFSDRDTETEIGIDYFRASSPVDISIAHKIVQEYAKQHNLPAEEFLVRARLPKTNIKARKLDDSAATNLTLVKNDKQEDQAKIDAALKPLEDLAKDVRGAQTNDNLTSMAQALHDAHNKRKDDVKPEAKLAEQKASAEKPEGATVKRTEQEKQKKRPYQKREKEKSARSLAALRRYQDELQKTAAQSPTIMQPVAHNATPQEYDAAVMELATAIAKILKSNTGAL
jgi:hypothetical protein